MPLLPNPHVLVVDDDPAVRSLCAEFLGIWGYAVTEACDGQDALEKLALLQVQLVLLDVNMPRLAGDTLLARLREEQPTLPVVMMSSETDGMKSRCMQLGARGFLAKPFGARQLRSEISLALTVGRAPPKQ